MQTFAIELKVKLNVYCIMEVMFSVFCALVSSQTAM